MQFRLGPNRTGWFGLLQPVADGIKLFFKEEVIPEGANRWLFVAAPAVAILAAFLSIAVVPYGAPWAQIADLEIGVLFLFAISSLGVYAIVLAGWSANNKYTMLGALRSSAQMFSYELALGLSWVGVILLAGSFRLQEIVTAQDTAYGALGWYCVKQFPAFIVYLVAATAEVNRTPFDLPEAETELVAGYQTEYSGMRYGLFAMAEYINMITLSGLAVTLFFGGWTGPALPGPLWFVIKLGIVVFVFMWLRATLPRLRYDQLMQIGWKVLLPVATLNAVVTAVLVVAID
jgi:NADH-quinone oxidoreductase subunit H